MVEVIVRGRVGTDREDEGRAVGGGGVLVGLGEVLGISAVEEKGEDLVGGMGLLDRVAQGDADSTDVLDGAAGSGVAVG